VFLQQWPQFGENCFAYMRIIQADYLAPADDGVEVVFGRQTGRDEVGKNLREQIGLPNAFVFRTGSHVSPSEIHMA
jgi:hypothetical protein